MDELWDQIGARLKRAREKAELSVEDVVFRAKIPRTVVEALEAEDFSVFTSPTYAKSFLRQYSEFLDVDADPWLNALEPAAYVGGDTLQPMFASDQTSPLAKRSPRESRHPEQENPVSGGGKWSAMWLMFLTAALVICVIKGYQVFDEKFGKEEAAKVAVPDPAAGEKKAEPAPVVTESQSPESDESTQQEPKPPSNPPRALIIRE